MAQLGTLHIIYIAAVLFIIAALLKKKEIVLPCIIGIFAICLAYSHNFILAVQMLYRAIVSSAGEFIGIIIVISLIMSMSKSLEMVGADQIMIRPLQHMIHTRKPAFFLVGCVMLIFSWFIWPSPAVALIGALLLPVALNAGLPAIWAAVAMNIFGHGIGLSSDFFIQGAPSITAKSAGISVTEIMTASIPIWAAVSIVTVIVSYVMFLRDMKKEPQILSESKIENEKHPSKFAYVIAVLTPAAFLFDIVVMLRFKIVGEDATALVGGTALIIMVIIMLFNGDILSSLEKITDHIKYGFKFSISIFAPVIVIAALFFMGNGEFAAKVLGKDAPGILSDIGIAMTNAVPVGRAPVILIESAVAAITGLDGSGFSGLPMVGSIAQTFSVATGANVAILAALGQVITIWIGGGTIIPWGVIPVAAICNVKPTELARKNLIPVLCGIGAGIITAFCLLS